MKTKTNNIKSKEMMRFPNIENYRRKEYRYHKYLFVYEEYEKLKKDINFRYPELATFLPLKYYYIILSERFNLSPNYVCSIINKVKILSKKELNTLRTERKKIMSVSWWDND